MSQENLEHIITRLLADDASVMKELFSRHYSSTCNAIFKFIKDKNLVEDLAQNVFIRFWEKRHQLNITTSIGAYLNRMAINEALGHIRKYKKIKIEEITPITPVGVAENAAQNLMHDELKSQINAAINSLPPKCQLVFKLSRFEDLTYKEIAAKLDISVKTVENQMGKALRVLREKMKPYLK